jgi:hypothetical protein
MKVDAEWDHVALWENSVFQRFRRNHERAGTPCPRVLIVNWMAPGDPLVNHVQYFAEKPFEPKSVEDEMYVKMLNHFMEGGNDKFRLGRLKMIPNVVEGPWVIKQAAGAPAIIGSPAPATAPAPSPDPDPDRHDREETHDDMPSGRRLSRGLGLNGRPTLLLRGAPHSNDPLVLVDTAYDFVAAIVTPLEWEMGINVGSSVIANNVLGLVKACPYPRPRIPPIPSSSQPAFPAALSILQMSTEYPSPSPIPGGCQVFGDRHGIHHRRPLTGAPNFHQISFPMALSPAPLIRREKRRRAPRAAPWGDPTAPHRYEQAAPRAHRHQSLPKLTQK